MPSPTMVGGMTGMSSDAAWRAIGRMVQAQRRFVGLTQENVAEYGGPGKTSMSKIERGVMDPFTPEAQQEVERVLGWPRGRIREQHRMLMEFGPEHLEAELAEYEYGQPPVPDLVALRREVAGRSVEGALADEGDVSLIAALTSRLAHAAESERLVERLQKELDDTNRYLASLLAKEPERSPSQRDLPIPIERQESSRGASTNQAPVSGAQDDDGTDPIPIGRMPRKPKGPTPSELAEADAKQQAADKADLSEILDDPVAANDGTGTPPELPQPTPTTDDPEVGS